MPRQSLVCLVLLTLLSACQPSTRATPSVTPVPSHLIPTETPTPAPTTTPQSRLDSTTYGPELEEFPSNVNPLTGQVVEDISLLRLPAVLVSISNMPITARPQAGINFAAWIFEIFIGEGATRFMGVFYGDYPRMISNVTGNCPVRDTIIHLSSTWIGNRVWLDENANGQMDAWEAGIGGVCVNLYSENSELLKSISTDSNGYYAFEVSPGAKHFIEFVRPAKYNFTNSHIQNDDQDSDANQETGQTPIFAVDATDSSWDAGLILLEQPTITPSPVVTGTPPAWYLPMEPYVGPIRSGRLTYNHIFDMFPNSCLVYASAGRGIREALHGCEIIYGVDRVDPNSALLTVTYMRELAEGSLNPKQPINYSGNLISDSIPTGGGPATQISVFYHTYNQSAWQYDPISQTYLRYTDRADATGNLFPVAERLTGRQVAFENVIVIFAEHIRIRHLQYDIDLGMGQKEFAWLFRDGRAFKIYWSTINREWEKKTGLLRPIHFVDAQNNPVPIHLGRTWIHIVTPYSSVVDQGNGQWAIQFTQPYDPKDTPEP